MKPTSRMTQEEFFVWAKEHIETELFRGKFDEAVEHVVYCSQSWILYQEALRTHNEAN